MGGRGVWGEKGCLVAKSGFLGVKRGKAVHKMLGNFGATFSISGNFSNFRQLFFYRATSIILRQSSK